MKRLTYPLRAGAALAAVLLTQLMAVVAAAQQSGQVPGQALGNASDADLWRAIRQGAGNLIQAEGSTWRALHNGPLSTYGIWIMAGMVFLLALFFLLRGRIKIEHGWAGRTIERFSFIERIGHWLTAGSFVILAVTGLNILYGKYFLLPVIGKEAFSVITAAGKFAHNWIAFAFMAGLVMIFLMWVLHNIPNRHDIKWILQAGGLFSKGVHPPAKKFNAGQKIVFWVTILGGLSLSLSGWTLLDPFTTSMFAAVEQDRLCLTNGSDTDAGTAICPIMACSGISGHDRDHSGPYLYRVIGHGRGLRRNGIRTGRSELGQGASQPVGR